MSAFLHTAIDKHVMFATTCSLDNTRIGINKTEKDIWATRDAEGKRYMGSERPRPTCEYRSVILPLSHFLPDNSLILLYLRQDGQVQQVTHHEIRYLAAYGPSLPPPYGFSMRKTIEVAKRVPPHVAVQVPTYHSMLEVDGPKESLRVGSEGPFSGFTARRKRPAAGGDGTRSEDVER